MLRAFSCLAWLIAAGPLLAAPNVLVILTDDQGWGDLSIHGNTNLQTPYIDSLAKDGAIFERFYVCPVCSPTRAEFLTGRYHLRDGVINVSTGGERLDLGVKTIADSFKAAGYATGCFGKWHNGSQYPYHPNGRGFDEYYGFTSGHWGDYFSPPLEHNGRAVQGQGYLTDDLTDRAIEFMTQKRQSPFFCYIPYNTPHSPMQVPDADYAKFEKADLKLRGSAKENLAFTRAALAMCENIDKNVGRLLKSLAAAGLDKETIVVFFCDNGPNSPRWNGEMRGIKGSTDEGGTRSPLLVRWPGRIAPGTKVAQIAMACDLLPSLVEMAGLKHVGDKPLDGLSLWPLLAGKSQDWPSRVIFSHWAGQVSARTQQYRLDSTGRLYDMHADPSQTKDIAQAQPEITTQLRKAVTDWRAEMQVGPRKDNRPYPVGYKEFPATWLPARDGVPAGKVQRSARAPNCSFFTNWQSTDDRMTWDIEVSTAGRYEVILHYTCPTANLGSEIEVRWGDVKTTAKITVAHDPPLRGAENDRVPRVGESLLKDFRPLSLGTLTLQPGRGLLTLRALSKPGTSVADVRAVEMILR